MVGAPSDTNDEADGNQTPDEQPRMSRFTWFLILVAIVAITVFLLTLGSKGNEISGVLSLAVAILTPFIQATYRAVLRKRSGSSQQDRLRFFRLRWKQILSGLAAVSLVGVGIAYGFWEFGGLSNIKATHTIQVEGGERMKNGSVATVTSPLFNPPKRGKIDITPQLRATAATGSCVAPASLDVAVEIDGEEPRNVAIIRSGQEVTIETKGAERSVEVKILLREPDPMCEVDLTINSALLYS